MQNKNPTINPVVVLRKEFDDWAVLFNPDTAEAVGINPIGVAIWELLEKEQNLSEIIEHLNQQFADVPESVHSELELFIDDLTKRGFVGYVTENTDGNR